MPLPTGGGLNVTTFPLPLGESFGGEALTVVLDPLPALMLPVSLHTLMSPPYYVIILDLSTLTSPTE